MCIRDSAETLLEMCAEDDDPALAEEADAAVNSLDGLTSRSSRYGGAIFSRVPKRPGCDWFGKPVCL